MNSIVDIGASAYSQLKKLKNEINEDTSVDEERTQAVKSHIKTLKF